MTSQFTTVEEAEIYLGWEVDIESEKSKISSDK